MGGILKRRLRNEEIGNCSSSQHGTYFLGCTGGRLDRVVRRGAAWIRRCRQQPVGIWRHWRVFGIHGGYDYDFGATVIGAALDYDFANIELDAGSDLKNVARLKFRLGYDTGPALIYVAAGGARARADQFGWDSGYFGGLGADFLLDPNFSLGVELLSHRFDNFDGSGIDVDLGTAAIRAVFRF